MFPGFDVDWDGGQDQEVSIGLWNDRGLWFGGRASNALPDVFASLFLIHDQGHLQLLFQGLDAV
jgi:hypothetical protein